MMFSRYSRLLAHTSDKSAIQGAGMNSGGLGSLQDNSITTQNGAVT